MHNRTALETADWQDGTLHITRLLLTVGLVLATATQSRADVGVIVLEPVRALGFFTRVGHAGTYFSNICPDGSPIRMRLCRPGEHGGVISKYSPLSENEDYDWAIVPFDEYLHGFTSPELAPIIGTPRLQRTLEQSNFGPLFSGALTSTDGHLPDGQWRAALATRFDRSIYIFTVETSAADDATIVDAFNSAPNKSRFNFFYRNCSDQTKGIFDLVMANIGDRTGGITMETPKGLAKALVTRGLEHPELHLRVRRYPQIPGTFPRSRDVLFPMENTYRSIAFAPWWFFGGFREVALGSMLYHEVISPFDVVESYNNFMSPTTAQLAIEQHQLRQRQDEIRPALTAAQSHDGDWPRLAALNERVSRRLGDIRTQQRVEVSQVVGSKAEWQELEHKFQSIVGSLGQQMCVPGELMGAFAAYTPDGTLSEGVLQHLEANGTFYVAGSGGGPWLSLPLPGGEVVSTGLSASHVLAGDPRLAVLVLAAVIDDNLSRTLSRREEIAYADRMLRLFRQASAGCAEPHRQRAAAATQ